MSSMNTMLIVFGILLEFSLELMAHSSACLPWDGLLSCWSGTLLAFSSKNTKKTPLPFLKFPGWWCREWREPTHPSSPEEVGRSWKTCCAQAERGSGLCLLSPSRELISLPSRPDRQRVPVRFGGKPLPSYSRSSGRCSGVNIFS